MGVMYEIDMITGNRFNLESIVYFMMTILILNVICTLDLRLSLLIFYLHNMNILILTYIH
jgi:hypothetical protein